LRLAHVIAERHAAREVALLATGTQCVLGFRAQRTRSIG
jgi:hypothetical protein